jgi:HEAT repeat protein
MHLVPAAPGILAIGGWLLSRTLDWAAAVLLRDRRWARRTALAALLPGVIVVLSMVGPACYRAGYVLAAAWLRNRSALVELAHPRAPLVIEPAAGRLFLSLRDTARFLAEHTAPGEFVFPFPVLDVLCFLSDRHNPTRHGYFYPGWPGHAVEAEVLDDLRTRPPRWIVLLHAHPLFFAESPVYFFNLRRFVTEHYAVEARIGMFELLRPGSLPGPEYAASEPLPEDVLWKRELRRRFGRAPRELLSVLDQAGTEPERLASALLGAPERVRSEFIQLVRKSRSRSAAPVVARLLENSLPGSRSQELAIRALAERATAAAVPALLRAYESRPELRPAIAGILFHIGSKLSFEAYWFSSDEVEHTPSFTVDQKRLIDWLDDPFQPLAIRSFAIRAAGRLQERSAIPMLARLVGDRMEWRDLSAQAADSLAALGAARKFLPAIVALLDWERLWVPAVVAQQWDPADTAARAALEEFLAARNPDTRQLAFWIAAGLRDPAFQPWLEAGLWDADVQVRLASAWGLGELGERSAIPLLQEALQHEPDEEARRFTLRALQKLGAG